MGIFRATYLNARVALIAFFSTFVRYNMRPPPEPVALAKKQLGLLPSVPVRRSIPQHIALGAN